MGNISVVTFDLWDTLIQENPRSDEDASSRRIRGIGGILVSRGLLEDPEQLRPAYEKSGRFLEAVWSRSLDIPVEDHILYMLRALGPGVPDALSDGDMAEISRIYVEMLLDRPPVVLDGAENVLETLVRDGYRLALISNTGRTPGTVLRTILGRMGLLRHFEVTAFSNELLARKPSPKVFGHVLTQLGVSAGVAVHVGDDTEADIAGAMGVGMRAVQVALDGFPRSELADGYVTSLDEVSGCVRALQTKL